MSSLTESMRRVWYSWIAPRICGRRESVNAAMHLLHMPRSYLWSHEKRVELGKDPEHLMGVPSGGQAVSQARDDLVLDTSDPFVVGTLGRDPNFSSL